jgi:hypothetical protein
VIKVLSIKIATESTCITQKHTKRSHGMRENKTKLWVHVKLLRMATRWSDKVAMIKTRYCYCR